MGMVYVSGATLLLALAVLGARFASARFPSVKPVKPANKFQRVSDKSHEGTESG